MTSASPPADVFDILGCGFGPANLAIAAAITDKWAFGETKDVRTAVFIEKYPEFLWHPGMLIPGSRMQISCLKDLVMLRNPSSPLTFLSYLHSQNRLVAFINRGSTIPTRREFADYLSWAAREVEKRGIQVAYAEEVIGISKLHAGDNEQELIEVTSRLTKTGELVTRRTKSLVLSPGGSPVIPPILSTLLPPQGASWNGTGFSEAPVIHSSSYMTSVAALLNGLPCRNKPVKIAVVGSGQSAAECLLDVHKRLEAIPAPCGPHEVHMILRKGSLKPSDDSPFVNEIFDPSKTDEWYNYPTESSRRSILAEYKNTNYSVVNPVTLDTVYELVYDQKVSDDIAARNARAPSPTIPRVAIHTYQKIVSASAQAITEAGATRQVLTLTCQHSISHEITDTTYDAIICGTGYDRKSWLRLLCASNLADDYLGLAQASNRPMMVKLAPQHHVGDIAMNDHDCAVDPDIKYELVDYHSRIHDAEHTTLPSLLDSTSHSSTGSSASTPPSSPGLSLSAPRTSATVTLRISRNYRLVPRDSESHGKIYLQGCTEATHGLSDTLLSVLGVRAGEVLDDICANLGEGR